MREKIDKALQWAWPGMKLRPLWLTALAVGCLVVYHHHAKFSKTPEWFIEWSRGLWNIEHLKFHQHGFSHTMAVIVLMLTPLLITCIAERMSPLELGLSIRHAGKEILLVLGLWAAFLPVVWFLSKTESFSNMYPRFGPAETDVYMYVAYEGFYLIKWIAWEFFFRGFMLFAFRKDFGGHAVLISTIPFVLMHFGKPEAEVIASFFAGLILCWIALRSKSIWPGVILHWLVAASMDFFAATWWRPG